MRKLLSIKKKQQKGSISSGTFVPRKYHYYEKWNGIFIECRIRAIQELNIEQMSIQQNINLPQRFKKINMVRGILKFFFSKLALCYKEIILKYKMMKSFIRSLGVF